MKAVSVIAVRCNGQGKDVSVYGDRLNDAMFRDLADAHQFGDDLRRSDVAVIVRPNYNDPGGNSYREWRSFNGEPFKEVVFSIG